MKNTVAAPSGEKVSLKTTAAAEPFVCGHRSENADKIIFFYTFFLSLLMFVTVPVAVAVTGETDFWANIFKIMTTPCKLVTDYFALAGLGSTFFNVGVCGLACNIIMKISKIKPNATTIAGYMLVIAHGFYGLNFINMWPPLFGVWVYCKVMKKSYRANFHISLFATAVGPFISDFLFRYTINDEFVFGEPRVTLSGVVLAILFGLASGFVIPALLPGTTAMHRGYNMYKAGLAIGILGVFVYAFMYKTLGVNSPDVISFDNPEYYSMPYAYRAFVNCFLIILFAITILMGFLLNNRSFKGYKELIHSTGYGIDFLDKFGMPVCLINLGVYGLCAVAYLNIIFILPEIFPFIPEGVGFTGPTLGATFAALTFSCDGQHPRNVWPIITGYALLFVVSNILCLLCGMEIPWTLSSQAYINGIAFATGLCTFAGKYGWKVGVCVGFASAIICTSTVAMHGGFVLYNGGFTAGLTALIVLPVLDFYKIKPKFDDDLH